MKLKGLAATSATFCGTVVCLIAAHAPISRAPQRLWSLAPEYELSDISPDGKLAAYIDWTTGGNLAVRDLVSGATRVLTNKTGGEDEAEIARFSPDGTRILFNWWDSKTKLDEFRTIGPDGSDMKTVYRSPSPTTGLWPAMWTADGASILLWVAHFDSNHVKKSRSSALVPVAGGSPRVIPGGGSVDAISTDGRFFASTVRGNDHDIVITSATDGKEVSRVTTPSSVGAIRFSRDGLVFSSLRGGSPGIWKQPMRNGKSQGGPRLVRGDLWRLISLDRIWLDPVGRLYYEINAGDRDAYAVNIDAQTGRTRSQPLPLSKNPGADYNNPQFSPDGKYVAMIARSAGRQEVLIRSLSGDEVRRFPLSARIGLTAQWIPGAQALAVTVIDSTFNQNLVRLDLASGEQSVVFKQGGMSPVALSPDGKTVYYAPHARDAVSPRVVARELASGTERDVYSAPRGSSAFASAVSRDGKTLIVALVHAPVQHPYKVLAVSVANGAVRDLSAAVAGADTANGGQRAVGFTADQTAQILLAPKLDRAHTLTLWRVPLGGGAATELGPAPKGIEFNGRQATGSWLSPDATRLVYVGGSLKTELWVIDEPAVRAELAMRH